MIILDTFEDEVPSSLLSSLRSLMISTLLLWYLLSILGNDAIYLLFTILYEWLASYFYILRSISSYAFPWFIGYVIELRIVLCIIFRDPLPASVYRSLTSPSLCDLIFTIYALILYGDNSGYGDVLCELFYSLGRFP